MRDDSTSNVRNIIEDAVDITVYSDVRSNIDYPTYSVVYEGIQPIPGFLVIISRSDVARFFRSW